MSKNLPYVAVTMGDGAGIGPEVIVPAMLDPQVATWCHPVVIGDAARLRLAARVLGLEPQIVAVERVSDAEFIPGRINVIDLGLLPDDLPWANCPLCRPRGLRIHPRGKRTGSGRRRTGDLHRPLNKEALHAAGHIFPATPRCSRT